MELRSTTVTGYLRLRLLAGLRRFRPASHRFREEQAAIEAWLALIIEAAALSGDLALEAAECARLIKGYGDTMKRGLENYRRIETALIRPALSRRDRAQAAADAVTSARVAALTDPEGESLTRTLDEIAERRIMVDAAE